jgi:hypothetical protein
MTFRSGDVRDRTSHGLADALRLLGRPKRRPTDADRPPVTPASGRKVKPLPGQLDSEGNEAA